VFIDWVWRDVRIAFRAFLRSPLFMAVAVVSLAVGIGANTAIFSFVNAILLKQLPVPQPDRLVSFAEIIKGETSDATWRMTTVDKLAKRNTVFSGVFGCFSKPVNFSRRDSSQWIMGELVTGEYFRTLQLTPAIGRFFTVEDVRNAKANPVCVLSYDFWQREFAGDPNAVAQSVLLNGHPYRVLGITPRGFFGAVLQHRADVQVPATRIGDFMPAFGDSTGVNWLDTLSWLTPMARLKPGITLAQAQQNVQAVYHGIEAENGTTPANQRELRLRDGSQGLNTLRSSFGRPALVLLAVAGIVLLVTCANLANLLLARAQVRSKEFAVRLSLGASRARLIQQLFVESLVIALCGGLGGTALSYWITGTLIALLNTGRSAVSAIVVQPDIHVLVFSFSLSLATALLFGLLPAWPASKQDSAETLRQQGHARLRRMLVVAQVALSLTIVFAAGLLARTLRSLQTLDLGFQPDRVIALSVDPAANGYSSTEEARILDELLQRVRALPGVKAASLASSIPFGASAISLSFEVPGHIAKNSSDEVADFNFISHDYFATLGQPLLRGRDFTSRDDSAHPRVAIVNRTFARKFWPDLDPIGRKFRQGGSDVEIVGVVKDARDRDLRAGPAESVYLPAQQAQTSGLTLLVRARANPAAVIPSLLALVAAVDRHMPVYAVHTLDVQVEAGLSSERMLGYLSALFAALATLLAGVGLYGVMAYSVTRRTREIGIRIATGAQQSDIGLLFARESLALIGLGLLIGVPVSFASVHVLKTLLFGVTTADPFTLAASVAILLAASAAATILPLRRAMRVSPMSALRYE
jgi:predicted permease